MIDLINILVAKNIIVQYLSTIMEETDGCAKQYRCATYFHLLLIIDVRSNVIINYSVGSPGNGKDVLDSSNTVDKQYI